MYDKIKEHFVRIGTVMKEIGWILKRFHRKEEDDSTMIIVLDNTRREGIEFDNQFIDKIYELGYNITFICEHWEIDDSSEMCIHVDAEPTLCNLLQVTNCCKQYM